MEYLDEWATVPCSRGECPSGRDRADTRDKYFERCDGMSHQALIKTGDGGGTEIVGHYEDDTQDGCGKEERGRRSWIGEGGAMNLRGRAVEFQPGAAEN